MHKGNKWNQNMGKSVLAKWPKLAAEKIKIDPQGYTGTCLHRFGTTTMANNGESSINLKCAGGWQSNKLVQDYIVQSKHIKFAQVEAIAGLEKPIVDPQVLPKKLKVAEKVPFKPAGEEGDGASSEADEYCKLAKWAVHGTVVTNNYCISSSEKEE
eukprot:1538790-Ditylum_brightwellii.AAC.1